MTLVTRRNDVYYIGGANLRGHRRARGLSQEAFAQRVSRAGGTEITQMQISRWEAGHEFPVEREVLDAILNVLDIPAGQVQF